MTTQTVHENANRKTFRKLDIIVIAVTIAYLILGILSIINDTNYYAFYTSLYGVAGFLLMIYHGIPTLGKKNMVFFYITGVLVGFFFEAMGANFGLFFSKYTYPVEAFPGPRLANLALLPFLAYGALPYTIWAMAQAIVGVFNNKYRRNDFMLVPMVCAAIIVAIDFATDPIMSSLGRSHLWENHGVFYGIPLMNYVGWYIFGYTLFQVLGIGLYFQSKKGTLPAAPQIAEKKRFWYYPIYLYGLQFIQHIFYIFNQDDRMVTLHNSEQVWSRDVYQGVLLVSFATVLVYAFFAFLSIRRTDSLE